MKSKPGSETIPAFQINIDRSTRHLVAYQARFSGDVSKYPGLLLTFKISRVVDATTKMFDAAPLKEGFFFRKIFFGSRIFQEDSSGLNEFDVVLYVEGGDDTYIEGKTDVKISTYLEAYARAIYEELQKDS